MISASEVVETLRRIRNGEIVVTTMSGLGFWGEPGERDFRLLGLMGAAAALGLGIAIARPDETVWVVDGDGSLLMQLGALAAVSDAAPEHYVHIVVANGVYAISGAQPLPAAGRFQWSAAARAAGYRSAVECQAASELEAALSEPAPGPRMIVVHCDAGRPEYPPGSFSFDASREGHRVRVALAGALPPVDRSLSSG